MARFIPLVLLSLVITACSSGSYGSALARQRATQSTNIEGLVQGPAIRNVTEADHQMLWEAAHGFLVKNFPDLDVYEPQRRFAETRVWEWQHEDQTHLTKIAIEVLGDEKDPKLAHLGVFAQMIVDRVDIEGAQDGRQIASRLTSLGANSRVQEFVADKIIERYLLLRSGRNPDALGELPDTGRDPG